MPTVHFVVSFGQSNEVGAFTGTAPAGIPAASIYFLEYLPPSTLDTTLKALDRRPSGHYGAELTCGLAVKAMLPAGDELVLVKNAKGGTTITDWVPGDSSGFHTQLLAQITTARTQAAALYPGNAERFYLACCQGEAEAAGAVAPTSWAALFLSIQRSIEAHVDQPLFPVITLTHASQVSNAQLSVVRAQQTLAAYRTVSNDDVPLAEGLHLSTDPGQTTHGTRRAAALRDVIFMGSISTDLANKSLDHVLGGGNYTRPATVYLAAFVAGVESAQIARLAITNNATNFPAAASRAKSLATVATFAAASADAGNIDEIRIYDASSGGNEMARDSITPVTVNSGGVLEIGASDLTFTFAAGYFSDYLALEMLDHWFGGADYTRPATVYLGGCSADPQTGGSMITENRKAVTNNATNWPAAASRSKAIGAGPHDHTAALSNIGTVSHVGVWDASTAGNLLLSSALTTSRVITTGQVLAYRTGEVVFAIAA